MKGVWSVGDRTMAELLMPRQRVYDNHALQLPYLLCSIVFLLCKFIAVAGAVASGGSGGVFAPALVLGAALGSCYGSVIGFLQDDPHMHLLFVPIGMAATFSGMIRLPLTSVVIVFEMTSVAGSQDSSRLVLSVAVVSLVGRPTVCVSGHRYRNSLVSLKSRWGTSLWGALDEGVRPRRRSMRGLVGAVP